MPSASRRSEPLAYFFEDPFARVLMTGITDASGAEGVGVSLVSAAIEDDLAWNVRSALVDGLILFCLEGANRLIASSRERRLPFVALAFGEADETVPVVGIDDIEGGRLAARHLAALGHRRFAVLAMEFAAGGSGRATPERVKAATYPSSRRRVEGNLDALREVGIDTQAVPVFETLSDEATVHAALEEIFAAPAPPTAILAQSDRIAMIALRWLQARKVAVPGGRCRSSASTACPRAQGRCRPDHGRSSRSRRSAGGLCGRFSSTATRSGGRPCRSGSSCAAARPCRRKSGEARSG